MADDHGTDSGIGEDREIQLRNSRTHDNLRAAYLEEAAGGNALGSFAQMAEIEGFAEVARLLRELAEMEALHAGGHLDFLRRVGDPLTGEPIGDTRRNLQSALEGRIEQAKNTYPAMVRAADAEGFTEVSDWFRTLAKTKAAQVEKIRRELGELKD